MCESSSDVLYQVWRSTSDRLCTKCGVVASTSVVCMGLPWSCCASLCERTPWCCGSLSAPGSSVVVSRCVVADKIHSFILLRVRPAGADSLAQRDALAPIIACPSGQAPY